MLVFKIIKAIRRSCEYIRFESRGRQFESHKQQSQFFRACLLEFFVHCKVPASHYFCIIYDSKFHFLVISLRISTFDSRFQFKIIVRFCCSNTISKKYMILSITKLSKLKFFKISFVEIARQAFVIHSVLKVHAIFRQFIHSFRQFIHSLLKVHAFFRQFIHSIECFLFWCTQELGFA